MKRSLWITWLLISTDAGLLPSTVIPKPEWSLGILGGHFPCSSPPFGGNSPTGDEWLQGNLPRSHLLLFSHLFPPVFFACSFHIHLSIKLHGKFMQLLLKKYGCHLMTRRSISTKKGGVLLAVGHVFYLVVEPNPFEQYACQNGFIFPNFRGEHEKCLSCHHLWSFTPSIGDRLIPRWLVEILLHWVFAPLRLGFSLPRAPATQIFVAQEAEIWDLALTNLPTQIANHHPTEKAAVASHLTDVESWHRRGDQWWSDQWVLSYL